MPESPFMTLFNEARAAFKESFEEAQREQREKKGADLRPKVTALEERLREERAKRMQYEERAFALSDSVAKLGAQLADANAKLNGGIFVGTGLKDRVTSLEAELADAQRQQAADVETIKQLRHEAALDAEKMSELRDRESATNARLLKATMIDVEFRQDPGDGNSYYVQNVVSGVNDESLVSIADVMGGHRTTIPAKDWADWIVVPKEAGA
jgi:chromosome segregation ATPase